MKKSVTDLKFHLHGLDYLRAMFIIFVVMWHQEVGINPAMKIPANFPDYRYLLFYILIFNVLLLAVPGFLLISNFLFIYKDGTLIRLKKNIKRFIYILVFWSLITNLFYANLSYFTRLIPKNGYELYQLITGGAFGINFFLVSLCLTQIVTYFVQRLTTKRIYLGSIFSLFVTFCISFISLKTKNTLLVSWFSPLSFISVPFLAVLLNRIFHNKPDQNKLIWISLITGLTLAIVEWFTLTDKIFLEYGRYGMPDYMRPSVFLFSTLLIILSFKITQLPGKLISILSKYSLSIYLIHPIYINQARILAEKLSINYLQLRNVVASIISIIISISIAKIMSVFLTKITGIGNDS